MEQKTEPEPTEDFIDEISVVPGEIENPDHFMTSLMTEETDFIDDCAPAFADIYTGVLMPI